MEAACFSAGFLLGFGVSLFQRSSDTALKINFFDWDFVTVSSPSFSTYASASGSAGRN